MHTGPRDSSGDSFGQALLAACFLRQAGAVRFSKVGPAKDPSLLREAALRVRAALAERVDSLCVLATSGIPFGCVLSQQLYLPVYFFRARGWPVTTAKGTREYKVLPHVRPGSSTLLVDSHMRTGRTAAACCTVLTSAVPQVRVAGIVTLVGLDHMVRAARPAPQELSVVQLTSQGGFLAGLFQCAPAELYTRHLAVESDVWQPWASSTLSVRRWAPS